MQRLVPIYGIRQEYERKLSRLVAGSKPKEKPLRSDKQASAEAVRLSVLKELWFPILRSFAGLIMERSESISNEALARFRLILENCHRCFDEAMWREVLSQVLLPVLEDNRLQVDLATKKHNGEQALAHCRIVQRLLRVLNEFAKDKLGGLSQTLIVSYIDIVCQFASNLANKPLALVTMGKLEELLEIAGPLFESK
mmetsp:Transcript_7302/g.12328  ORF Transcript_7302/g.12328 Transcript_7302/m.12328 type:complete len:197 (+) Transcript_7302:4377-4967(+)